MWHEFDSDKALIQYLLGELSPEERDAIEDRYFVDDALHEQLVALEEELIDSYVAGDLSAEQRAHFEEWFLRSAERGEKLKFARALSRIDADVYVQASLDANPFDGHRTGADDRKPAAPTTLLAHQALQRQCWRLRALLFFFSDD